MVFILLGYLGIWQLHRDEFILKLGRYDNQFSTVFKIKAKSFFIAGHRASLNTTDPWYTTTTLR